MKTISKPTVWRWILERCGCVDSQAQMPVADDEGEDCNAYEKLHNWNGDASVCEACGQKYRYIKGGSNW